MVMTTVYVVESRDYQDWCVIGAFLSMEEVAHSLAHHYPGEVAITAFDKDRVIGGSKGLYVMNYYREIDWRDHHEETITLSGLPDFQPISPIVCVRDKPDYVPDVTVVGSDESQVAQAFSDALAAESLKRGWGAD